MFSGPQNYDEDGGGMGLIPVIIAAGTALVTAGAAVYKNISDQKQAKENRKAAEAIARQQAAQAQAQAAAATQIEVAKSQGFTKTTITLGVLTAGTILLLMLKKRGDEESLPEEA